MKIFVGIASYCDKLLFFTIKDCIQKADRPKDIIFGVVDQNDTSQKMAIETLAFKDQIKYVYINKIDTLGVSWARNIVFSLHDDEEFLLQIDSHMLFDKGWDSELLKQYSDLKKLSEKPIITTYPYDFSFNKDNIPSYIEQSYKYVLVLRPHPETKLEEKSAVLRFRAEHQLSDKPILGCHIAGGFIFTSADFIQEVPYDPFLYFHGEEQSLAIRSYTRGWDIYHPNIIPLHHYYKKTGIEYLSHHWHKDVDSKRSLDSVYLRERATLRLNRLLYGDGMKSSAYGLGNVRSLDEYCKFSGIDYKNRRII